MVVVLECNLQRFFFHFCKHVCILLHFVSKNVLTLIVNNFYKLEPILIIFGTLYAETAGFYTHLTFSTSP